MKTFITKIAYLGFLVAFGVGFFAVTNPASAGFVSFNNDAQDVATLRAANASNGGSWTSSTVSAAPGDTISYDIYYHNTGTITATNVRIKMSPSTTGSNATTNFVATATISADNYSGLSDSTSVAISSPQTMAYVPGTATWFPNQSATGQSISDSSLFTSGINIGSVTAGWSSQGHLRVQYLIGMTVLTPTCNDGIDNDGDSFIDYPNDPDCTSANDSENVFNGNTASAPIVSTSNASNITDTSAQLNGHVDDANGATVNSCWFKYGTNSSALNQTAYASCSISNSGSFNTSISGLANNTTYYFQAWGQNSQGQDSGSVISFSTTGTSMSVPDVSTNSASSVGDTYATLNGYVNDANGATVTSCWFKYGTSSSSLNQTIYASCNISNSGSFQTGVSGLSTNTTYYFQAWGQNSQGQDSGSVLSFYTTSGSSNTVPDVSTYSATNIYDTYATLNGYVNNTNGSNVSNCWFKYGTYSGNLNNTSYASCNISNSGSFESSISGLSTNTTYYFQACAQNSYGQNCGSTLSFYTTSSNNGTVPSVTTNYPSSISDTSATLEGYLNSTNTSVTRWFKYGTYSGNLNNTVYVSGTQSYSGAFNYPVYGLTPNTTYYVQACAQNSYGQNCGGTLSFVTTGGMVQSNVSVTTTTATNITQSSATLNGLVINSSNDNVVGWFEYGSTTGLGSYSTQQVLGTTSTISFYNTATGLSSNHLYYYRAVARAADGTLKYGQTLTFVTLASTVPVVPVIIHTGTVLGTGTGNGSIMLSIDSRYENVYAGDIIDYTVIYKNISGHTLQNAVLRVIFPKAVAFRNSSTGDYSLADNALTIQLGTLIPSQTGTYYVSGQVATFARLGDVLVTTANLVYTNTNGAQEEAVAYEINHVNNYRNPLLGLALFGAGFWPNSLLGWLVLLAIIFGLVYVARKLYAGRGRPTGPNFS